MHLSLLVWLNIISVLTCIFRVFAIREEKGGSEGEVAPGERESTEGLDEHGVR